MGVPAGRPRGAQGPAQPLPALQPAPRRPGERSCLGVGLAVRGDSGTRRGPGRRAPRPGTAAVRASCRLLLLLLGLLAAASCAGSEESQRDGGGRGPERRPPGNALPRERGPSGGPPPSSNDLEAPATEKPQSINPRDAWMLFVRQSNKGVNGKKKSTGKSRKYKVTQVVTGRTGLEPRIPDSNSGGIGTLTWATNDESARATFSLKLGLGAAPHNHPSLLPPYDSFWSQWELHGAGWQTSAGAGAPRAARPPRPSGPPGAFHLARGFMEGIPSAVERGGEASGQGGPEALRGLRGRGRRGRQGRRGRGGGEGRGRGRRGGRPGPGGGAPGGEPETSASGGRLPLPGAEEHVRRAPVPAGAAALPPARKRGVVPARAGAEPHQRPVHSAHHGLLHLRRDPVRRAQWGPPEEGALSVPGPPAGADLHPVPVPAQRVSGGHHRPGAQRRALHRHGARSPVPAGRPVCLCLHRQRDRVVSHHPRRLRLQCRFLGAVKPSVTPVSPSPFLNFLN